MLPDSKTRLLLQYLLGCRQVIKMKFSLDDLKPAKLSDRKPSHFSEVIIRMIFSVCYDCVMWCSY